MLFVIYRKHTFKWPAEKLSFLWLMLRFDCILFLYLCFNSCLLILINPGSLPLNTCSADAMTEECLKNNGTDPQGNNYSMVCFKVNDSHYSLQIVVLAVENVKMCSKFDVD